MAGARTYDFSYRSTESRWPHCVLALSGDWRGSREASTKPLPSWG